MYGTIQALPHGEAPVYLEGEMIYCFKKLRELRLTRIFFLHYSISLTIGGAAIAGLILLGGGLQFYSFVVLCIMYTQPTFFILRRIKMYEARQELKHGTFAPDERINLAIQALHLKPNLDMNFIIYTIVLLTMIAMFVPYNGLMIVLDNQFLGIPLVLLIFPGMLTLISIVKKLEEKI